MASTAGLIGLRIGLIGVRYAALLARGGASLAESFIEGFKSWLGMLTFIPRKIAATLRSISLSGLISKFREAGSEAMNAMLTGLKSAAGTILDWISGLGSQIASRISSSISGALGRAGGWLGFGDGGSSAGAIDGARAAGGSVRRGGSYLVGEEGVELFTPRTNGRIVPNDDTMAMLRRSGSAAPAASGADRQGAPNVVVNVGGIVIKGVENFHKMMDQIERELSNRIEAGIRASHYKPLRPARWLDTTSNTRLIFPAAARCVPS